MIKQDGPNTSNSSTQALSTSTESSLSGAVEAALDMPSVMEAHLNTTSSHEPISPNQVVRRNTCEFPATGLTMRVEALTTAA